MADRTEVQRQFIEATAKHMRIDADHEDAIDAEEAAVKAISDAGDGDNVELIADLVDEAILLSGLGEDHPIIKQRRESFQAAMRQREAVANGMDPREAALIIAMGGDPRMPGGGLTQIGGGDFEF